MFRREQGRLCSGRVFWAGSHQLDGPHVFVQQPPEAGLPALKQAANVLQLPLHGLDLALQHREQTHTQSPSICTRTHSRVTVKVTALPHSPALLLTQSSWRHCSPSTQVLRLTQNRTVGLGDHSLSRLKSFQEIFLCPAVLSERLPWTGTYPSAGWQAGRHLHHSTAEPGDSTSETDLSGTSTATRFSSGMSLTGSGCSYTASPKTSALTVL